ncbi:MULTISPECIES: CvpA family protein [Pseudobutyrivibrio]|jgi:uncharacterized membrane protein required for colicin V production|uniref:Colicin V production protein n=1 Tax=Pseudobutyrivibrio ruminis TaxID=46206 RepID=A0A2G3EBG2_9FIRM|nr:MULTISPECIES: CvpA family protein [Pseudobutyrivibrio]MBE5904471.1 hypothetical protein [Pseudobutyrivibrio sp.]PHU40560.1 hypothetical protein CSX00_04955 [Pseudobutyrivibrio ruminis]
MDINILLVIFIVLMVFFIVRGAQRGMIRIIYSLVAWIFLLLFVNYGKVYVADYIKLHTEIPTRVENAIDGHLHTKYDSSEAEEVGSGRDAVLSIVPEFVKDDIETSIENSIDNIIKAIAKELSDAAINGISNILLIAVGIIIIYIIDRLLRAVGFVPGIRDVNRLLGIIAGAVEGMLVTWFAMYLADCFPTSFFGQFIITYAKENQMLYYIYTNNLIERIIGI